MKVMYVIGGVIILATSHFLLTKQPVIPVTPINEAVSQTIIPVQPIGQAVAQPVLPITAENEAVAQQEFPVSPENESVAQNNIPVEAINTETTIEASTPDTVQEPVEPVIAINEADETEEEGFIIS